MFSLGWSFSMGSAYQFHSWRVFVVVCALPCVCAVVALTFMPESPRFYLEVSIVSNEENTLQPLKSENIAQIKKTRLCLKLMIRACRDFLHPAFRPAIAMVVGGCHRALWLAFNPINLSGIFMLYPFRWGSTTRPGWSSSRFMTQTCERVDSPRKSLPWVDSLTALALSSLKHQPYFKVVYIHEWLSHPSLYLRKLPF